MSAEHVFENNRNWAAAIKKQQPDFFDKLAQGQDPDFLFIGCSDSRVPAAEMMGLGPGDVFVQRNVANQVIHTDMSMQAVIEYAVLHLGVRHIVVCGHSSCGGVKAAMGNADLAVLNPWLNTIRDTYAAHQDELDAITDEDERTARMVALNVHAQCVNVARSTPFQKAHAAGKGPEIHGWVFHLETGELENLNVDVSQQLDRIHAVYGVQG